MFRKHINTKFLMKSSGKESQIRYWTIFLRQILDLGGPFPTDHLLGRMDSYVLKIVKHVLLMMGAPLL